jgi:hypothetical protein
MADLLVGQLVELELERNGSSPPTRIDANVIGLPPREIQLALTNIAALPAGLEVGRQVWIRFSNALGLHQTRCAISRVTPGKALVVALARAPQVETVQRRKFFRVPAALSVRFDVLTSAIPEATGKVEPRGLAQDISAGGIRLESSLLLAVGDWLHVTVQVPRGFRRQLPAELACEARVVRVLELRARNKIAYGLGLEFEFASESERDRWVHLTFDLQRGVQI